MEGSWVVYAAHDGHPEYGSTGYVLSSDCTSAHVLWKSGSLMGPMELHDIADLSTQPPTLCQLLADRDDSLYWGALHRRGRDVTESAREAASDAVHMVMSRLEAVLPGEHESRGLLIRATAKKALREILEDD